MNHEGAVVRVIAERDAARAKLAEAVAVLRRVMTSHERGKRGPDSNERYAAHMRAYAFLATVVGAMWKTIKARGTGGA